MRKLVGRASMCLVALVGFALCASAASAQNPNFDSAVFTSTETGGIVQDKKDGTIVSTTSSTVSEDGVLLEADR